MLYSGQGRVYAAVNQNGQPGPFRFLGNCSTLNIQLSTQTEEHQESTSGLRLTDGRLTVQQSATVQIVLDDFMVNNLAMGLYGQSATVAGGSVTDEPLPDGLQQGDIVRLRHPGVSSVVIRDSAGSPSTLSEGTDYRILSASHGSIEIIGDLSGYTQPLVADYEYAGYSRVGMFTSQPPERWLRFEGLNTAAGNAPVLVELYRVLLDPLGQLDLISDTFSSMELAGSALYDSAAALDDTLGPFGRVIYLSE